MSTMPDPKNGVESSLAYRNVALRTSRVSMAEAAYAMSSQELASCVINSGAAKRTHLEC